MAVTYCDRIASGTWTQAHLEPHLVYSTLSANLSLREMLSKNGSLQTWCEELTMRLFVCFAEKFGRTTPCHTSVSERMCITQTRYRWTNMYNPNTWHLHSKISSLPSHKFNDTIHLRVRGDESTILSEACVNILTWMYQNSPQSFVCTSREMWCTWEHQLVG